MPPRGAARAAVSAEIARRLPLSDCETLVEQGGVYALVGPTGVGKTTTIAKLAARCVVRRGAASLALLTTDSYRIAAHDQLRIYGKILNVPVYAIKDTRDLQTTLAELRDKKTVLIDTIGMSQRDRLVAEQTALLMGGGASVKRLLLLNATANAATLDEVITAYAQGGIHGSIVTKVDEAGGSCHGPRQRDPLRAGRALRDQRPARARRPAFAQSRVHAGTRLAAGRGTPPRTIFIPMNCRSSWRRRRTEPGHG